MSDGSLVCTGFYSEHTNTNGSRGLVVRIPRYEGLRHPGDPGQGGTQDFLRGAKFSFVMATGK